MPSDPTISLAEAVREIEALPAENHRKFDYQGEIIGERCRAAYVAAIRDVLALLREEETK